MKTTNDIHELLCYFCPFNHHELATLCTIGDQLWLGECDLFEILDQYREDKGYLNFTGIAPVEVLLAHIRDQANAWIREVTGYDFIQYGIGGDISVFYHRDWQQAYRYTEEARQALKENVLPYRNTINQDQWCRYFLQAMQIKGE